MMRRFWTICILVLLAVQVTPSNVRAEEAGESAVIAEITVDTGQTARLYTPVAIDLSRVPLPLDAGLRLVEQRGEERRPVPAQLQPGETPRLWFILDGATPAGGNRIFTLHREPDRSPPVIRTVLTERHLDIVAGDTPVLRYNHALVPPPEGVHENYVRSAFIHPLWAPNGEELTRIHPSDHYHHMGLWSPWTKTKFEGRDVDFWNLGKGQGTVRFAGFLSYTSGPVFGGFRARQEHVDLSAPGGVKAALNEVWDVRAFATLAAASGTTGGSTGGRSGDGGNTGSEDAGTSAGGTQHATAGQLVDFAITQSCATASPLELAKYRYGGFGFRATGKWNVKNSDYLTSEGKTRADGHASRSRWCIVQGTTDLGSSGVLFMSHPQNHAHPEPMRIWPQGDVFFNYCPIQADDWILQPGIDHVLRYRLCLFEGAMNPKTAERLWQDFAHPPASSLTNTSFK